LPVGHLKGCEAWPAPFLCPCRSLREIFRLAWVGALQKIPAKSVEEKAWRATF
jgi:hypothetical protein